MSRSWITNGVHLIMTKAVKYLERWGLGGPNFCHYGIELLIWKCKYVIMLATLILTFASIGVYIITHLLFPTAIFVWSIITANLHYLSMQKIEKICKWQMTHFLILVWLKFYKYVFGWCKTSYNLVVWRRFIIYDIWINYLISTCILNTDLDGGYTTVLYWPSL